MASNYADDFLSGISNNGMTDEIWEIIKKDNLKFKNANIENEKQRNLFLYIEHFMDELCKEFGHKPENIGQIVLEAYNNLKNNENVNLLDIRKSVYDSLKSKIKLAYPNISGIYGQNSKPERNIEKWIKSLSFIYSEMQKGKSKTELIKEITKEWPAMEKLDFETWLRYYWNGDHEKYNIQKNAALFDIPQRPQMPEYKPEITEEMQVKPIVGRPKITERTLEQDKQALISRLDSAIKILRKFVNVWPQDVWQRLSEMLFDLQREVLPLKTKATMVDCIIKTANKLQKEGFDEGAYELYKVADAPPVSDIASKIEKALSGKKYEEADKKEPEGDISSALEQPAFEVSESELPGMPQEPAPPALDTMVPQETMPQQDTAIPAELGKDLPAPAAPPMPPMSEEIKEKPMNGENPFADKNITVKDVVESLQTIAKQINEREFVRSLTKIDLMLDSLNMASFFPELGESLGRALDMTNYISPRLEKIINKLSGSLKEEEKSVAPEVEMTEFPQKERVAFEVEEPKK